MYDKLKNIDKGLIFLLIILAAYFASFIFAPDWAASSLQRTGSMFVDIIPILMFVFFINFLMNLWVKPELLQKYLGHDSGWKGYFYAVIIGIIIGGPPYILLPMLGNLKNNGVRDSLLATFLFNRNVSIPFLPALIFCFGLAYAIIVSVFLVIFSIPCGIIVEKLAGKPGGKAV